MSDFDNLLLLIIYTIDVSTKMLNATAIGFYLGCLSLTGLKEYYGKHNFVYSFD